MTTTTTTLSAAQMLREGLSHSTIAPLVGVSIGTISRVRNANA